MSRFSMPMEQIPYPKPLEPIGFAPWDEVFGGMAPGLAYIRGPAALPYAIQAAGCAAERPTSHAQQEVLLVGLRTDPGLLRVLAERANFSDGVGRIYNGGETFDEITAAARYDAPRVVVIDDAAELSSITPYGRKRRSGFREFRESCIRSGTTALICGGYDFTHGRPMGMASTCSSQSLILRPRSRGKGVWGVHEVRIEESAWQYTEAAEKSILISVDSTGVNVLPGDPGMSESSSTTEQWTDND